MWCLRLSASWLKEGKNKQALGKPQGLTTITITVNIT